MEDEPPRLAGQRHALLRRDHAVAAAPAELLGRPRRRVHLRALSWHLPRIVRLRVVERVRRDARPVALGVLAHVDEARSAGKADEAAAEPEARALRLVDVGEALIAD